MTAEVVSVLVLAALFVLATVRTVHLGAAALAASWLVGTLVFGVDVDTVVAGFPAGLFLTLVGVTYLFAFAERAGAISAIVYAAVRAVRGRISLIPWVMFLVTALITSVGALTPAAAAIVGPIAMGLAKRHRIHPVLMGMAVIQGASAGSFSPMGVYGVIINDIVRANALPSSPLVLFGASFGFILLTVAVAYFAFGGLALWRADHRVAHKAALDRPQVDAKLVWSLVGIVALGVEAFVFQHDVGFVGLLIVVVLSAVFSDTAKGAVNNVCWPTALLVCGVVTYVNLLQSQGVVDWLGGSVASIGAPLLAALVICLIAAVVSALASTTGILGALVPLAVPFLLTGEVWAIGLVAALAVSASVVDCSPFSTNGALMVAYTAEDRRERTYRQFLGWGGALVLIGPLVSWGALVVVPSLS
ncbi:SLC13 family permease [Xylanimonas ulmi]|uniref:UIT1 family transporter n=1 Tax=Xylanimonas ulmi TaxID=228973 RepID=A0A4Q7M174_9MICO|nr:SLC13 family permease [Xylanibacterium ulmi]RZS60517.1 UIT1 family transporter [Xylanibacterium ulmi]